MGDFVTQKFFQKQEVELKKWKEFLFVFSEEIILKQ